MGNMDDSHRCWTKPSSANRDSIVGGDTAVMPIQTAKQARNLAAVAVLISLAANMGIAHQASRSCNDVEKVKRQISLTLQDSFDRLISGRLDDDYRRIYGSDWVSKKQEDTNRLNAQIHRFDGRTCTLFFRRD